MADPGTFDWIFIAALLLSMFGWYFFQIRHLVRRYQSQRWPAADATIQPGAIGAISAGGASVPAVFMGYAYQVDGERYAGIFALRGSESDLPGLSQRLTGATLQIKYDPRDPNNSYVSNIYAPLFEGRTATQNPEWLNQSPQFDLQDAIRSQDVKRSR